MSLLKRILTYSDNTRIYNEIHRSLGTLPIWVSSLYYITVLKKWTKMDLQRRPREKALVFRVFQKTYRSKYYRFYHPLKDIVSVCLVCKEWNSLTKSESLRKIKCNSLPADVERENLNDGEQGCRWKVSISLCIVNKCSVKFSWFFL